MGNSSSSLRSIANDYELVIRASKVLEQRLQYDFQLEDMSLSKQIENLQPRLPHSVVQDLKSLVQMRNRLVHDVDVNDLKDLGSSKDMFCSKFERARQALSLLSERGRSGANVEEDSSGWGTLAVAAGAMALMAGAAMAETVEFRCDECRQFLNEGTRYVHRYKCRTCPNFDVCQTCWFRRPPSCSHRSFKKRESRYGEWTNVTWE